jgi:3-hydroxybutyryl-CoA dehydrogenase
MRVNILGSGYMGKQIASLFRLIGFDVLIWNNKGQDISNEIERETKKLEKLLSFKSLGTYKFESNLGKFENNFTVETVKEDLKIKKDVIASLNFRENIFSNTSSILLSNIADHVNGFHFMNPVSVKFLEICKKKNFSIKILNTVINELKKISYEIIDVKDTPGYIINKIIFKDISYFFYLVEVEKFDINTVLQIFKSDIKKINPIKLVNIIGVDTTLYILKNLHEYNKSYYVPEMLQKSVSQNVLGNKNKKLFTI